MLNLKLNVKQTNRLSEICMGIGNIALASVVIPALFDKFDTVLITWGLSVAVYSWYTSIRVLRK